MDFIGIIPQLLKTFRVTCKTYDMDNKKGTSKAILLSPAGQSAVEYSPTALDNRAAVRYYL